MLLKDSKVSFPFCMEDQINGIISDKEWTKTSRRKSEKENWKICEE